MLYGPYGPMAGYALWALLGPMALLPALAGYSLVYCPTAGSSRL